MKEIGRENFSKETEIKKLEDILPKKEEEYAKLCESVKAGREETNKLLDDLRSVTTMTEAYKKINKLLKRKP